MVKNFLCLLGTLLVFQCSSICRSQTFTLSDTNTSVDVVANSAVGVQNWQIYGLDNVATNTYLWRVGDSGVADYIQNLTLTSATQLGTQFLLLSYTNTAVGFAVDVTYALTGGTEDFDLAEVVRIRNTGANPLDFRLFQYNDFNLRDTPAGDTAERLNSSSILQTDGGMSVHYVEEGVAPVPNFSQLGPDFTASLTGTNGYDLDTAAGSGIGQMSTGDMSFGFQWNRTLAPGGNFTISSNKIATAPEPSGIAGLLLALGGFVRLKRRSKRV